MTHYLWLNILNPQRGSVPVVVATPKRKQSERITESIIDKLLALAGSGSVLEHAIRDAAEQSDGRDANLEDVINYIFDKHPEAKNKKEILQDLLDLIAKL